VLQNIRADATELSRGSDPQLTEPFCRDLGRREFPAAQDIVIMQHNQVLWGDALFSPNRVPLRLWETQRLAALCETSRAGRSELGFLSVRYPELCE